MLVLSRIQDETVVITAPDGTRITVAILGLRVVPNRPTKVRFGIDAPREYTVNRGEIQAAIDRGDPGPKRKHKPTPGVPPGSLGNVAGAKTFEDGKGAGS